MKYFAEDKGEGRERPLNGMLRPPQLSRVPLPHTLHCTMQEICFQEERAATELYASFHMHKVSKLDLFLYYSRLCPLLVILLIGAVILATTN